MPDEGNVDGGAGGAGQVRVVVSRLMPGNVGSFFEITMRIPRAIRGAGDGTLGGMPGGRGGGATRYPPESDFAPGRRQRMPYLLLLVALILVGGGIVWLHERRPQQTLESSIEDFQRGLRALDPSDRRRN